MKKWFHLGEACVFVDAKAQVEFYRYRTARIEHVLCRLQPEEFRAEDELLEFLAEKAGARRDNHVVYQVTETDGNKFAIGYSDGTITIGVGVVEQSW